MSTELSSNREARQNIGFSNYVRHRMLSADSRYRDDNDYLFFLLIVKELIDLKRSKQTVLRQTQRVKHMTLNDYKNITSREDLPRCNRSYEAFKSIRGTSPYYEQAKKNLMAILRQKGCPTLFLTMSCAEYKWDQLIKGILEVKERRVVDITEVKEMSTSARNKLLIENPVISTLHFHKRMEKLFKYFKTSDAFKPYQMADYFFRIEFQARGAPHLHSLIYLEEEVYDKESGEKKWKPLKIMYQETVDVRQNLEILQNIENCAKRLICASLSEVFCNECQHNEDISSQNSNNCENCISLRENVKTFNCGHSCGFSCHKKKKKLTIKPKEGHGCLDKIKEEEEMQHLICRYGYPKPPMRETTFIPAISQDIDKEILLKMKSDYMKYRKFLIRQSSSKDKWIQFKEMSYEEFLSNVGFMPDDTELSYDVKVNTAHIRYLEALAVGLRGNGAVFPKRNCCDIFTNNFNTNIMGLHQANMDIQIVADPWCCCEYMTDYITKSEAGRSDVLQSVDENGKQLTKMGVLDQISQNIDKKREVSIQEGVYRLLGLPMIKSSVLVKYVNTNHPNKRDGLLRGNIAELDPGESPFHANIIDYYQCRPLDESVDSEENLDLLKTQSWQEMCLADFVSCFDLQYGEKKEKEDLSPSHYELLDGKGRIKERGKKAILRYYLKYESDIDMKRGKLILFMPFRHEMRDIHERDIDDLYEKNLSTILENQSKYEFKFQGKSMAEILIEFEENREDIIEGEDADPELLETTSAQDLENFQKDFEKWKDEGSKGLKTLRQFVDVMDKEEHAKLISDLNSQQRKLHDDLCERDFAIEEEKEPFHVFISGIYFGIYMFNKHIFHKNLIIKYQPI